MAFRPLTNEIMLSSLHKLKKYNVYFIMSIKESAIKANSETNAINKVENECLEFIIPMCNQAYPPTNNRTSVILFMAYLYIVY